MKWLAIVLAFSTHFFAVAAEPVPPACFVTSATGDIRYRAVNSLNWIKLEERKKLYPGDLVFARTGATMRLEYVYAGAAVQLPSQTLFRIGMRPPTYTKLRRRFGVENLAAENFSKNSKGSSSTTWQDDGKNPFERVMVRNRNLQNGQIIDKKEKNNSDNASVALGILNETSVLKLELPKPNSTVIAMSFPAKLTMRVNPEFMGQKIWAFVWNAKDPVVPIWSGYSQGEFAGISIPSAGSYEVQVISEDESMMSETVTVEFKNKDTALPDILDKLRNQRNSDYTITIE